MNSSHKQLERPGVAILSLLFLLGTSYAAFADMDFREAGIRWQASFEGDQSPSVRTNTPQWGLMSVSTNRPPAEASSSDGNLWTQDTGASNIQAMSWAPIGIEWDSAKPTTLELRLKVNSRGTGNSPDDPVGHVRMSPATGPTTSRTYYLVFGEGWVDLTPGVLRRTPTAVDVDNSKFHTYRVTIENSIEANLYIDQQTDPSISKRSGGNDPGPVKFLWGDHTSGSGPEGGSFSLDYLRWTNQQAVPVTKSSATGGKNKNTP